LTIRSEASPEHTRDVAAYVDKTIRSIMNSGAVVESNRAAILAALQITDELFRTRATQRELDESVQALSSEVRRWLPPAKRAGAGG
jgi:cell division protein ZapA